MLAQFKSRGTKSGSSSASCCQTDFSKFWTFFQWRPLSFGPGEGLGGGGEEGEEEAAAGGGGGGGGAGRLHPACNLGIAMCDHVN